MMRLLTSILCSLVFIFANLVAAADDSGFVAVDPTKLDTVSGKNLMLTAYGIILGAILLYVFLLGVRDRKTRRSIDFLKKRLH